MTASLDRNLRRNLGAVRVVIGAVRGGAIETLERSDHDAARKLGRAACGLRTRGAQEHRTIGDIRPTIGYRGCRSDPATGKAATEVLPGGTLVHSFRALPADLAMITRSTFARRWRFRRDPDL